MEIILQVSVVREGVTQEKSNEKVRYGIKSIPLNQDGSAAYVLAKEKHAELGKETKKSVVESIEELVNEGRFPSVIRAEPSSDCRIVTVHTIAERNDRPELSNMIASGLYMEGLCITLSMEHLRIISGFCTIYLFLSERITETGLFSGREKAGS